MKIYLSPSDQWSNICSGSGHSEAYHCTQIADECAKYLRGYGYEVLVGNNSEDGTYPNRVAESNDWGADYHIPIHTNAGGGQGTLVMTFPTTVNDSYVASVYNKVASLTPTPDYGVRSDETLYEILNTVATCIYIECEFHDTETLAQWIDENVTAIGKAIADGFAEVDGLTINNGTGNNHTDSNVLYKVQCGAFKNRSNAEALKQSLINNGFEAVIKVE